MANKLPDSGPISMLDVYNVLNPPMQPQDCDYYFEDIYKFEQMKSSILIENNFDLRNITLGFSNISFDLQGLFMQTDIISTPKKIFINSSESFLNLSGMFERCSKLEYVSPTLFDNCKADELAFERTFFGCVNITSSLPDIWNKEKFPKLYGCENYAYGCTKAANYNEIPSNFGGPSTNPAVPLSIKQIEEPINKQSVIAKSIERIVDDRLPEGPISLGDADVRKLADKLQLAFKLTNELEDRIPENEYTVELLSKNKNYDFSNNKSGDPVYIKFIRKDTIKSNISSENTDPEPPTGPDPEPSGDLHSTVEFCVFVNNIKHSKFSFSNSNKEFITTGIICSDITNDIFICNFNNIPSHSNILKPIQSTISLRDFYGKSTELQPQDCDYYFETTDDFANRIEQICIDHNYDLSEVSLGFSDSITELPYKFRRISSGGRHAISSFPSELLKTPKFLVCKNLDITGRYNGMNPIMFHDEGIFCGTDITNISPKIFDYCSNITDFTDCFSHCKDLTSIPQGLFDKCPNVTDFFACFFDCSSLTTIPIGLFDKCPNVTSFSVCFYGCKLLESIPIALFSKNINVTNFKNCFSHCTSLTTVPQGLFDNCPNVTNFNSCFNNCSNITSAVPELWKTHPNANGTDCFSGCINAANYNDIPKSWGGPNNTLLEASIESITYDGSAWWTINIKIITNNMSYEGNTIRATHLYWNGMVFIEGDVHGPATFDPATRRPESRRIQILDNNKTPLWEYSAEDYDYNDFFTCLSKTPTIEEFTSKAKYIKIIS